MRTFILILFLLFDLASFGQGQNYMVPAIPSGGAVYAIDSTTSPDQIFVGTGGSAVNLGSNSYSLQYNGVPQQGTNIIVRFDATQLTAIAANVSIFGLRPLLDYPNTGIYYIRYQVAGTRANNKTVYVSYVSSQVAAGTFDNRVTFNNTVTANDSFQYNPHTGTITAGSALLASDSFGNVVYGCPPCAWNTGLNTGIGSSGKFGTTDTNSIRVFVNNTASGIISYNGFNTALGYRSLLLNTTGVNNTAFGHSALNGNTTGIGNVGIGQGAIVDNSTGNYNTGIGNTTQTSNYTGSYNTTLGYASDVSASNASYAIALGVNAIASSNELAISPNIEHLYIPLNGSSKGNVLTDTSGNGTYISQPLPQTVQTYYTPVTGDSITPFTGSNLINPAGTLANLTIRVPANPYSGQIMEFSFTQTITTLHWSIALNQAHSVFASVPTTVSQGGTIKIQYNTNTSSWYSW
jgi:hypothetical protein